MVYICLCLLFTLSFCIYLLKENNNLKVSCKQLQEKDYRRLQESFQEGRLIEKDLIVRNFKRSETTNEFCDWIFNNYLKEETKENKK